MIVIYEGGPFKICESRAANSFRRRSMHTSMCEQDLPVTKRVINMHALICLVFVV